MDAALFFREEFFGRAVVADAGRDDFQQKTCLRGQQNKRNPSILVLVSSVLRLVHAYDAEWSEKHVDTYP